MAERIFTEISGGERQMLAIAWGGDALYVAMNSRDSMDTLWPGMFTAKENAERPAEPLYKAVQGSNFGWPFCFYDYGMKKFLNNPEYGGDGKTSGGRHPVTPWGQPTRGFKTRNTKRTEKWIVSRKGKK